MKNFYLLEVPSRSDLPGIFFDLRAPKDLQKRIFLANILQKVANFLKKCHKLLGQWILTYQWGDNCVGVPVKSYSLGCVIHDHIKYKTRGQVFDNSPPTCQCTALDQFTGSRGRFPVGGRGVAFFARSWLGLSMPQISFIKCNGRG